VECGAIHQILLEIFRKLELKKYRHVSINYSSIKSISMIFKDNLGLVTKYHLNTYALELPDAILFAKRIKNFQKSSPFKYFGTLYVVQKH